MALLLVALLPPVVAFTFAVCRAQEVPFDSAPESSVVEAVAENSEPPPEPPGSLEPAPDGQADPPSEGQSESAGLSRAVPSSRGGPRPSTSLPELPPTPEPPRPMGDLIVEIAQEYIGYRYVWGGSSPRTGFDCSGFTYYVYRESGLNNVPRQLSGQLNTGPRIERDQLQPGDFVAFQNTYRWGLSHAGIYIGDGRFIHAVEPGVGVGINSLDEGFWSGRFVGGSRPWPTSPGS